ncbi:MAG: helix-turn-helix domain-containing protein [Candidatus Cloacimonetes bacterium]|nr:helix-turn-helix domain-containing protein [Candidatus Cloacimonadota bacterium]
MNKNLQNSINNIFGAKPSANQKAWGIINQFYHMVITKMEDDGITRADLARNLGKSRAAISQMFNKTPNISIKKMIEIADAVNLEINLTNDLFLQEKQIKEIKKYVLIPVNKFEKKSIDNKCKIIHLDEEMKSNYSVECCGF